MKVKEITNLTFKEDSKRLPTNKEIYPIVDDVSGRLLYIKNNFNILSHEFFVAMRKMVNGLQIKKIIELCAGAGWLSWWGIRYGIPILKSVDDFSWGRESGWKALSIVENQDAIKTVKETPNIDMYILSWPYVDDVAYRIWKSMKTGQYLLYIGEREGGCTASYKFFKSTRSKKVGGFIIPLLKFRGMHDTVRLFKK